jgi:hypothetical protein
MPNGAGTIDDAVDAAEEAPKPETPPVRGDSIFNRIGNSIDDLVKGVRAIPGAIKKAAYYTYYTAKAAVGLAAGVTIAGASALIGAPLGIATATNVLYYTISLQEQPMLEIR